MSNELDDLTRELKQLDPNYTQRSTTPTTHHQTQLLSNTTTDPSDTNSTSTAEEDGEHALLDALDAVLALTCTPSDIRMLYTVPDGIFPDALIRHFFSHEEFGSQFVSAILYEDNANVKFHMSEILYRVVTHRTVTPTQSLNFLKSAGIGSLMRNTTIRVLGMTCKIVARCAARCEKLFDTKRRQQVTSPLLEILRVHLSSKDVVENTECLAPVACAAAVMVDADSVAGATFHKKLYELIMNKCGGIPIVKGSEWFRGCMWHILGGANTQIVKAFVEAKGLMGTLLSNMLQTLHVEVSSKAFYVLTELMKKHPDGMFGLINKLLKGEEAEPIAQFMSLTLLPPESVKELIPAYITFAFQMSLLENKLSNTPFALICGPMLLRSIGNSTETMFGSIRPFTREVLTILRCFVLLSDELRREVQEVMRPQALAGFHEYIHSSTKDVVSGGALRVSLLELYSVLCLGASDESKAFLRKRNTAIVTELSELPTLHNVTPKEFKYVTSFLARQEIGGDTLEDTVNRDAQRAHAALEIQRTWRGHQARASFRHQRAETLGLNQVEEAEVKAREEVDQQEYLDRNELRDVFNRVCFQTVSVSIATVYKQDTIQGEVEERILNFQSRFQSQLLVKKQQLAATEKQQMQDLEVAHEKDAMELLQDEKELELFKATEREAMKQKYDKRREEVRVIAARERQALRDRLFQMRQLQQRKWEEEVEAHNKRVAFLRSRLPIDVEEERARGYANVKLNPHTRSPWWSGYGIYEEERVDLESIRSYVIATLMPSKEKAKREEIGQAHEIERETLWVTHQQEKYKILGKAIQDECARLQFFVREEEFRCLTAFAHEFFLSKKSRELMRERKTILVNACMSLEAAVRSDISDEGLQILRDTVLLATQDAHTVERGMWIEKERTQRSALRSIMQQDWSNLLRLEMLERVQILLIETQFKESKMREEGVYGVEDMERKSLLADHRQGLVFIRILTLMNILSEEESQVRRRLLRDEDTSRAVLGRQERAYREHSQRHTRETAENTHRDLILFEQDAVRGHLQLQERTELYVLMNVVERKAILAEETVGRQKVLLFHKEFISKYTAMGSVTLETDVRELVESGEHQAWLFLMRKHFIEYRSMREDYERRMLFNERHKVATDTFTETLLEIQTFQRSITECLHFYDRKKIALEEAIQRVEIEFIVEYRLIVTEQNEARSGVVEDRMLGVHAYQRVRKIRDEEFFRQDIRSSESNEHALLIIGLHKGQLALLHQEERKVFFTNESVARRRFDTLNEYFWVETYSERQDSLQSTKMKEIVRRIVEVQKEETAARNVLLKQYDEYASRQLSPLVILEMLETFQRESLEHSVAKQRKAFYAFEVEQRVLLNSSQIEMEEDDEREMLLLEEKEYRDELESECTKVYREYKATNDLQRVYRGHQGRKAALMRKTQIVEEKESRRQEQRVDHLLTVQQVGRARRSVMVAATRLKMQSKTVVTYFLQRLCRGFVARRRIMTTKLKAKHFAAIRIQKFMKCARSRVRAKLLRAGRLNGWREQNRKEENAAFQIQWWFRDQKAKRIVSSTRQRDNQTTVVRHASIRIQCAWRQHVARGVKEQKAEHKNEKFALRIQCAWRCFVARQVFEHKLHCRHLRFCAGVVQRFVRVFCSRVVRQGCVRVHATTQMQKIMRGALAKNHLGQKEVARVNIKEAKLKHHAAANIQRIARGITGRKKARLQKQHRSDASFMALRTQFESPALLLQRVGRGYRIRQVEGKVYKCKTEAAIRIQKVARGWQGKQVAKQRHEERTARRALQRSEYAATVIRRCYLVFAAKCEVKERKAVKWAHRRYLEFAASNVARAMRGWYVRKVLLPRERKRQERSRLILQCAVRCFLARLKSDRQRGLQWNKFVENKKKRAAVKLQWWVRRCLDKRNHAAYKIQEALSKQLHQLSLKREERDARKKVVALYIREVVRTEQLERLQIVREEEKYSREWSSALSLSPSPHRERQRFEGEQVAHATQALQTLLELEADGRKAVHIEAVRWWADCIRNESAQRVMKVETSFKTLQCTEAKLRNRLEIDALQAHRALRVLAITTTRHYKRSQIKDLIREERTLRNDITVIQYEREVHRLVKEMVRMFDVMEEMIEAARRRAVKPVVPPPRTQPAFLRTTDALRAAARDQALSRRKSEPEVQRDLLNLSLRSLSDDAGIVAVHRALMMDSGSGNIPIKTIRLEGNNLSDVAVVAIAHDVARSGAVTSLNLAHNPRITDVGGIALLNMIRCTQGIIELDLSGTGVTLGKRRAIQTLLDTRTSTTVLASRLHDSISNSIVRPASVNE
eukprot:PhF_6_TR7861/c0_g1_i3/m.11481